MLVAQLTDDVVWHDPGPPEVPQAGCYRGRERVGCFFVHTDETLEIDEWRRTSSSPRPIGSSSSAHSDARVKDTGRSYDNEWAMVWTPRDGNVAGRQISEDTAREVAAHSA